MKIKQTGDNRHAVPGTCNQTGNTAPKYPWSNSPIGRTARVAILIIAYHMDYTDDSMARTHEFPNRLQFFNWFNSLFPWFEVHYNRYRLKKAKEKQYKGVIEPFEPGDPHGRLRYCFAKPGKKGNDPKARLYGISTEHPLSVVQQKRGGRKEVFDRCSITIEDRLTHGKSVTIKEAKDWGR